MSYSSYDTEYLFVYGFLLKGFDVYEHCLTTSTYMGKSITLNKYRMFTNVTSPRVNENIEGKYPISGELFKINSQTQKLIDKCEGIMDGDNPFIDRGGYYRKKIKVICNSNIYDCYIYFCNIIHLSDSELISGNFRDIYTEVWYFAYGANMNKKLFSSRSKSNDFIMLNGSINNYILKFNKLMPDGSGASNIIECEGEHVNGILYKIPYISLLNIDIYEGFPEHYIRKNLEVNTEIGYINAYVYLASPKYICDGLIPNKKYIEIITS